MDNLPLGTPECNRQGIDRVITFVTDRGYLAQSLVAASQLAAQPDVVAIADIIIYLIDIPDEEQAAIRTALGTARFNFRFLDSRSFIPDSADRLPSLHVPRSTLGRLVLDAHIPAQYETILYMDGDIQIVGPVAPLVAHDCPPGKVLAGCDRLNNGGKYANPSSYLSRLGIMHPTDYMNAGIMMASRAAWRDYTGEALRFLTNHPECCKHHDQSALNAAIGEHRIRFGPAYNYTTWFQAADRQHLVRPRIVHFTGPSKPWNSLKGPWGTRYRKVYADFLEAHPYFTRYLTLDNSRDIDPKYVDPSPAMRARRALKSVKAAIDSRWHSVLLRKFLHRAPFKRLD